MWWTSVETWQPLALRAWLFDLDGVLTDTAAVHVEAWKATFDEFLGSAQRSFDAAGDYLRYVDGKPRYDGVRDFLASRGIVVPEGAPSDRPGRRTVCGLGNRKNALFLELLEEKGVEVFPDALPLVRSLRDAGRSTAVVSSSENCRAVLEAAGLGGLFYVVVDGLVARRQGLAGKPAPDTFLYGAGELGVSPLEAAVVEDATSGVAAGRAGGFGLVVGVARRAGRRELFEAGADLVVGDLSDFGVLTDTLRRWGRGSRSLA